jgi:predicted transposase YbfD/YdcC
MQDGKHPKIALIQHFSVIPDPRVERTREHRLVDVLIMAVCTLLCGGESFYDMEEFGHAKRDWFESFLDLPNGIPSHDTFNRVFAALDPDAFLNCFVQWTQALRQTINQEIVAIDGKALRRAYQKKEHIKYIVSAWAEENHLVLGQVPVDEKSNEITAIPELLRVLELSGCIVTLDAMGCQRNIAKEIKEADADYVLALKGNQASVHEEVKSFLDAAIDERHAQRPKGAALSKVAAGLASTQTIEKGHGRIETRRYYQSDQLGWFADRGAWEGLTSVGVVEATREINGSKTTERRYYLSSLPVNIELFAHAVRSHWGIENKLHWVLDISFGEDYSRARSGHAAENLATLRRLALNLLKKETTKKRSIKGKQLNASWDHSYLTRLLAL